MRSSTATRRLQYELLSIVVNPTVAYLLLLVGIVGIAIELFSPGLIIPGAVGTISLLLGAFGSAQLPVTAAGIALLVIGLVLIIAEAQLPTHGVLGVAGVLALVFAGLLLFDTESEAFEVSVPVVIVTGRRCSAASSRSRRPRRCRRTSRGRRQAASTWSA